MWLEIRDNVKYVAAMALDHLVAVHSAELIVHEGVPESEDGIKGLKAKNAELHARINAMDLAVDSWKWLYKTAEAETEELKVLNAAYEKQVGGHISLRAGLCNEISQLRGLVRRYERKAKKLVQIIEDTIDG